MDNIPIEQFRAKLRAIERAVWFQNRNDAVCCGVTIPQCHAILEIGAARELNLKKLSARIGLDTSTVSRTVESLVKDGLAVRTRSTTDRRATVIRLSDKGSAAHDRINSTWNRICRDMFRRIPRARHTQLMETVSILAKLLTGCCLEPSAENKPAVQRHRNP